MSKVLNCMYLTQRNNCKEIKFLKIMLLLWIIEYSKINLQLAIKSQIVNFLTLHYVFLKHPFFS